MSLTHTMKVTNKSTGEVEYLTVTRCCACFCDVVVPEVYAGWHRRVVDPNLSTMAVKCLTCGGGVLDHYMYASPLWRDSGMGVPLGTHQQVTPAASEAPKHGPLTVLDLEDDDYTPFLYRGCGHTTYVYRTFSAAHEKLRKFIIPTEVTHEQPGTMESSLHDGPEVYEGS